ncbi:hypothetical protein JTB14_026204 [Gonioctena quinquepunctata]|nr:hypothetical protein JTB14_026204 [Gonioctena quinquepunctata]
MNCLFSITGLEGVKKNSEPIKCSENDIRNATEVEVARVVKIWLRTAPDQQGGRNRRRTKTAEEGGMVLLIFDTHVLLV